MRVEGKDEKAEKGKWPQRHFCVIYIDGRLYVGIKGKGEPCLTEMMIYRSTRFYFERGDKKARYRMMFSHVLRRNNSTLTPLVISYITIHTSHCKVEVRR